MNNKKLLFYSKHIFLKKINLIGQENIFFSKIIIIGIGGLGSILTLYSALLGIKKIILIDNDIIELSNIQRQILFNIKDLNKFKVICAKKKIKNINSDIKIIIFKKKIDFNILNKIIKKKYIIIDCSDNFNTKYLINQICVQKKKKFIISSAIKFHGQIVILNKQYNNNPCYNCLFPLNINNFKKNYCYNIGVFSPLIGIIGLLQIFELIKLIINKKKKREGEGYLKYFNLFKLKLKNIIFKKNKNCYICKKFKY